MALAKEEGENLGSDLLVPIIKVVYARKKTTLEEGAFVAPGGNVLFIITVVVILSTYIPKLTSGDMQMWLFTAGIYGLGLMAMLYYKKKAN